MVVVAGCRSRARFDGNHAAAAVTSSSIQVDYARFIATQAQRGLSIKDDGWVTPTHASTPTKRGERHALASLGVRAKQIVQLARGEHSQPG